MKNLSELQEDAKALSEEIRVGHFDTIDNIIEDIKRNMLDKDNPIREQYANAYSFFIESKNLISGQLTANKVAENLQWYGQHALNGCTNELWDIEFEYQLNKKEIQKK